MDPTTIKQVCNVDNFGVKRCYLNGKLVSTTKPIATKASSIAAKNPANIVIPTPINNNVIKNATQNSVGGKVLNPTPTPSPIPDQSYSCSRVVNSQGRLVDRCCTETAVSTSKI